MKTYIFIHAETEKETDAAVLVKTRGVTAWLPKKQCVRIHGGFWKVPEWLAVEKGLTIAAIPPQFDVFAASDVSQTDEQTYPEGVKPFDHQRRAFEKMIKLRDGALFMEMGTGKTKVAFDLCAARLAAGEIDKIIWFAPLNVIADTKRQLAFNGRESLPVVFFGVESISSSERVYAAALEALTDKTALVIDEAHKVKNPQAIRSQRIKIIAQKCKFRLGLTGTPITHSPADLFGIFSILDPTYKIIGYKSYDKFEREHLVLNARKEIIGYINIDKISERLAPYIFQIQKTECLDLPPKIFNELSDPSGAASEAAKAYAARYQEIKQNALIRYGETKSAEVIMKMLLDLQVHSGGGKWYAETGFICPKLAAFVEWYKSLIDVRCVVWARFTAEIKAIKAILKNAPVFEFHGETKQSERAGVLKEWSESKRGVLIANVQTGGVGIDLTAAHYCLFYSNSFRYADRIQAEDRFHRIGQKNPVNYYDLHSGFGIDEKVTACLRRKSNLRDNFIEMVQNNQEKDFFGSL